MKSTEMLNEFYAPGRVNLIGEYTDFNGGLVFPCAINRGTKLTINAGDGSGSDTGGISLSSAEFAFTDTVKVHSDAEPVGREWVNYPLGVMVEFAKLGFPISGYRFHYTSDLPTGAGLSSSASISVVTAYAINKLTNANLSRTELALLAQRCENEFINMQCGIMDQFVIANAQEGCAMALSCDSLQYDQVPLRLGDYRIVIGNTNQPRELKSSAYNERVAECQSALSLLSGVTGAQQLAHVTPEQLEQHGHLLKDTVVLKRATHVIQETDRVRRASGALNKNDLETFGQLMVQSHQSLKELFEVSSHTLDCMVELAVSTEGVVGSRMTGAGFGGCTVSLVHADAVDDFIASVGVAYEKATKLQPAFYVTTAANGVAEVATS